MTLLAAALLSCTPALPFFCQNIHIGCAGRSRVETQSFEISDTTVTFTDGTTWQTHHNQDRNAAIFRHTNDRDWIRIEADHRFTLRRYENATALMTRGICKTLR